MNAVLVLLLSAAFVVAAEVELRDGITPQRLPAVELQEFYWQGLRNVLVNNGELKAGFIEADVTDYVLKVIPYLQKDIIELGLDPMELSEQHIKLIPTGTIDLTNGWLEELSSLNISGSVIAKYSMSTKILELTLPVSLDSLLITYDYHTKIILLSIKGAVDAKVSNVRLNLHLGFNFTNDHAFVDKADVKNTGKITVKLTGLGLLDWIIDLMDGVLITLFHGIILSVVNLIIQNPIDSIVNSINDAIDGILHSNSTELFKF